MSDKETTGQRIARRLEELDMSAQQAAEACGISADYIHRLVRGDRKNVTEKTLRKIAAGLNIPLQLLVQAPELETIPEEQLIMDRYGQAMKEAHEIGLAPEVVLAQIRLLARVKNPGQ